ncbi:MAG TPA: hypothetical protein VGM88_32305 [Kofleriaceae bacterium]|jgi:hypothetical protein
MGRGDGANGGAQRRTFAPLVRKPEPAAPAQTQGTPASAPGRAPAPLGLPPYVIAFANLQLAGERARAAAIGIPVDAAGRVAGAEGRAPSVSRSGLIAEIDRRYDRLTGVPVPSNARTPEQIAVWNQLRDEVLFEQETIAKLPDSAKRAIAASLPHTNTTPADLEALFEVAQQLAGLPPGATDEFAAKVAADAGNLAGLAAAIATYRLKLDAQTAVDARRENAANRLAGTERVFERYVELQDTPHTGAREGLFTGARAAAERELSELLPRYGFADVDSYERAVHEYEATFALGAAGVTADLLDRYAATLYAERRRYTNPNVVAELHSRLAPLRKLYGFVADANAATKEQRDATYDQLQRFDAVPSGPLDVYARSARGATAEAASIGVVAAIATEFPILREDFLPVRQRIKKPELATATPRELRDLLLDHIEERVAALDAARGELADSPDLVLGLDQLTPKYFAELDVQPGSVHEQIIRREQRAVASSHGVTGALLTLGGVLLTIVTEGAGAPLLALGSSLATFGVGTYLAGEAYGEYKQQQRLAAMGLAPEPNSAWLALAFLGAGLDAAGVVSAVRELLPVARVAVASGDLVTLHRSVERMVKAGRLSERAAVAAERATAARAAYAGAKRELAALLTGRLSSAGLLDPAVYRALVKMAVAKLRVGAHSLTQFVEEVRAGRAIAALAPEDLAAIKRAWDEATALNRLEIAAGGEPALQRLLTVFPRDHVDAVFAAVPNPHRLALLIDFLGSTTARSLVKNWLAISPTTLTSKLANLSLFLDRLDAGGALLAETAPLGANSVILDTQLMISLDADTRLGTAAAASEKANVTALKARGPNRDLRLANASVGEMAPSASARGRGVPLSVSRESTEYQDMLGTLEQRNVGGAKGAADRSIIADAFFAKTEAGVIPLVETAEPQIVSRLRSIPSSIGSVKAAKEGFEITIYGRTIHIVRVGG